MKRKLLPLLCSRRMLHEPEKLHFIFPLKRPPASLTSVYPATHRQSGASISNSTSLPSSMYRLSGSLCTRGGSVISPRVVTSASKSFPSNAARISLASTPHSRRAVGTAGHFDHV